MRRRSQWRARYVGTNKWKRFAEPMLYMFIFSTIAMTLPFAFTCRESGCFTNEGGPYAALSSFCSFCPHFLASSLCRGGHRVQHRNFLHLPLCAPLVFSGSVVAFSRALCEQDIQDAFKGRPHFEEYGTEPSVHKYNELATLMHVSGAFVALSLTSHPRLLLITRFYRQRRHQAPHVAQHALAVWLRLNLRLLCGAAWLRCPSLPL